MGDLVLLAQNSLRDPALAVRQLQSLNLPMQVRWMALAVVVALSAILGTLAMQIFPQPAEGGLDIPVLSPLVLAVLRAGVIVLTAWLIATVGRAFGGQGDFPDSLLIVIWLEFLLLIAQVAQVVLMLVLPSLGDVLSMAALMVIAWPSVQMIKALHGFSSAIQVFIGMIGTTLLILIFLTVLAGAFGLMPQLPPKVPS